MRKKCHLPFPHPEERVMVKFAYTSTCFGEEWPLQHGSSPEPQKCVQKCFYFLHEVAEKKI